MRSKVLKPLGCAVLLAAMLLGFQNCAGGGGGGGGGTAGSAGVTCGAGTHDNGSGVCTLDNALAIQNTTGNYWRCLVNSVGFLQFFADGTGQYHHSDPPGILATTWSQTVGATDSITFTAGVNNFTFSSIVPNAPVGAVSLTAKINGVSTSCTLVNTAMP